MITLGMMFVEHLWFVALWVLVSVAIGMAVPIYCGGLYLDNSYKLSGPVEPVHAPVWTLPESEKKLPPSNTK